MRGAEVGGIERRVRERWREGEEEDREECGREAITGSSEMPVVPSLMFLNLSMSMPRAERSGCSVGSTHDRSPFVCCFFILSVGLPQAQPVGEHTVGLVVSA